MSETGAKLNKTVLVAIAALLVVAAVSSAWVLWTRSAQYQIKRILADGPAAVAAVRESDGREAVAAWAQALGRLGRADDALSVAHHPPAALRTNRASFDASALSKVARGLAEAGKADEARKATDEALAAARGIPRKEVSINVLEDVGQVLAWSGKTNEAKKTLENALAVARQIQDDDLRASEVAEVAQAMAAAGNMDDAKRVCQKALAAPPAKHNYFYTQAFHLSRVAEALARAGDFKGALALSRQIGEKYGNKHSGYARLYAVEAKSYVAQTLCQARNIDQAKRLWDEVSKEARRVEDDSSQATALALVARTLVRGGQVREADTLLSEALAAVRRSQTEPSRSLDLSDVAITLAEAGKADEALAVARQSAYQVEALSRVAEALARTGRDHEARTAWAEVRAAALRNDEKKRPSALMSVARAGARLHLYREARLAAESCPSSQKLYAFAAILTEYAKEDNLTLSQRLELEE